MHAAGAVSGLEKAGGDCNCIFLLGPTAVGKTAIGVQLALALNGEIISADSRQVYAGLDIGSGKDLADYDVVLSDGRTMHVPYHLIDITDLSHEYNLFDYQEDFYRAFSDIQRRGKLPVVVGGTGMYADCILRNYDLVPTPENPAARAELEQKSYDELKAMLIQEKQNLHNTTDFADKDRIIHALLIERYLKSPECAAYRASRPPRPVIRPLVLGTTLPRTLVRERIARRLRERLDSGMIEEVKLLHEKGSSRGEGGASWERLEQLGLEYRFVSEYLEGAYGEPESAQARDALFEKLNFAIGRFAKRQETWFRGMEKKGVKINWLPEHADIGVRTEAALSLWQ
ncbi:MAG: tRNA (adenosine(37)-N6)-dimethylallyltransferase MiaA [Treponema sp.]|nr:tRNA (adenosine(37)-N6)-dimethylallyltransferase MiaA [Treponema sp.]